MSQIWYLCNGQNGKANTVCLLNHNGELRKSFPDIAHLDLSTTKIPSKDARERLQEYNEDVDLSGMFFDLSHKTKDNNNKTYPTIFNLTSVNNSRGVNFCMNYLKLFAEQRKFKYDRAQNIQLDNDWDLHNCMKQTMKVMTSLYYDDLNKFGSMLPYVLKQLLTEYQGSNYSINDFIEARSGILYNIYSNYPALRNILLELMLCTVGKNPSIRDLFIERNKWKVTGIEPSKYEQLAMFKEEEKGIERKRNK